MIVQISMDIDVGENITDISDVATKVTTNATGFPVLGSMVTASWQNENKYKYNDQTFDED